MLVEYLYGMILVYGFFKLMNNMTQPNYREDLMGRSSRELSSYSDRSQKYNININGNGNSVNIHNHYH